MYGSMTNDNSKDKIQQQIQANLKRVYDEALNEPVPPRFQDLLDQLKNQDKTKGSKP
jgi:hypothetical protein